MFYVWDDVVDSNLAGFNGLVLDFGPYVKSGARPFGNASHELIMSIVGKDGTNALATYSD